MTLAEFAELLRSQSAIKRNNKRAPNFVDIPSPILARLASVAQELSGIPADTTIIPAQPELGEGVREMSTAEALAAMRPITGSPALAEAETVEATIPSYDLATHGFRGPWPANDATTDYLSGASDEPPPARERDPFVSPAPYELVTEAVEAAPKAPEPTSEFAAPGGGASSSPSTITASESKPRETTPSIEGGGATVPALYISATTPPPMPGPIPEGPCQHPVEAHSTLRNGDGFCTHCGERWAPATDPKA